MQTLNTVVIFKQLALICFIYINQLMPKLINNFCNNVFLVHNLAVGQHGRRYNINTLGQTLKTPGKAFNFLLRLQKCSLVFQKLNRVFWSSLLIKAHVKTLKNTGPWKVAYIHQELIKSLNSR